MYLRRLRLRDFRNYEHLDISFSSGITILHGPNGAGKTNLLEAIRLAASGEALRAQEGQEMIRLGQAFGFVAGEFVGNGRDLRLEVALARTGQRRVKVDGAAKRRVDLIGLAPVVHFSADDIVVVKGEPAARRRLIDTELSAISRRYYFHLGRYRRALEQRNRLLKDVRAGRGRRGSLAPWDRALARYGAPLMVDRHEFITALGPEASAAHRVMTGGEGGFVVEYRPSVACLEAQSIGATGEDRTRLVENIAKEIEAAVREETGADVGRGTTGLGPHRDDVELRLRGQPARGFASQGEQRSCAVAIRLGLARVVGRVTGESPALLLDDVLSELDARYREGVFAACEGAEQVVITCCDVNDIPAEARVNGTTLEVSDGRLI